MRKKVHYLTVAPFVMHLVIKNDNETHYMVDQLIYPENQKYS